MPAGNHLAALAAVISYETYQALKPALADLRAGASAQRRGQQMAAVLEKLAQLPECTTIADAAAWQSQERHDRSLPGRDIGC